MRRFVLIAHRVPVNGAFTLNDLAGGAGRMDEVARAVSTAFTLSNDLRRDTQMDVVFAASPPPAARRVALDGSRLRYLNPDERSTAALLKNALVRSIPLDHALEVSPGLKVVPVDPGAFLTTVITEPGTFWLTESGSPIQQLPDGSEGFTAILSDPVDPTPEETELLQRSNVPRVSVGPRSVRSSQCIDIVHNEFDRRGAARAGSGR